MIGKRRWIVFLLTPVVVVSVAPTSDAFEYSRCRGRNVTWDGDVQTLQANQNDFPTGSAWRASLEASVAAWNTFSPAANFRFGLVYNTAADDDLGDGRNSVVRIPDIPGAALAVTRQRFSACIWPFWRRDLKETDVVIENSFDWNTATHPHPFDAEQSSTLALLHELGHAFGLKHDNDVCATMNETGPRCGPIGNDDDPHPHADDVAGNRAGYGTDGTEDDLIATAFRPTPVGLSTLIRPPRIVSRGNPATFPFTVGNRGTVNRTAQVRFYLSVDRRITTTDLELGSTTLTLNAGVNRSLNATTTIPLTLAPGLYHFGYIIDPTNAISETDEGNNAVGHGGRTLVSASSPPNACFVATPTSGRAPLRVTVNASCSTDPDGSITQYRWDMGDGGGRTGSQVAHTYFQPEVFTITLTVTDNEGRTDTATKVVRVLCGANSSCPL